MNLMEYIKKKRNELEGELPVLIGEEKSQKPTVGIQGQI